MIMTLSSSILHSIYTGWAKKSEQILSVSYKLTISKYSGENRIMLLDIKNSVCCFILFNINAIRSDDTLKTLELIITKSLLMAIHSRRTDVLRAVMFM